MLESNKRKQVSTTFKIEPVIHNTTPMFYMDCQMGTKFSEKKVELMWQQVNLATGEGLIGTLTSFFLLYVHVNGMELQLGIKNTCFLLSHAFQTLIVPSTEALIMQLSVGW